MLRMAALAAVVIASLPTMTRARERTATLTVGLPCRDVRADVNDRRTFRRRFEIALRQACAADPFARKIARTL